MRTNRLLFLFLVMGLLISACAAPPPTPAPATSLPTPTIAHTPSPTSPPTSTPTAAPSPTPTPFPAGAPQWFRSATLYEIFVRSFADSNGDGVGDLNGITQHLDYLATLGVDVIWLMPIYPSPSEHGYDITNFFAVNPDYGTMDDLHHLLNAAHARGIHIILDFVPSHLSRKNPIFQDALGNPSSRYSKWFVWTNKAHTAYATFAGNEEMPRFNHYNPEVVAYLCKAARFWLDPNGDGDPSDGVDGFRVDNATFPPASFRRALRQAVKATNPNALLLGEAWVHSAFDLAQFHTDEFDALFDFPFYELMMGSPTTDNDGMLGSGDHPIALWQLLWNEEAKWVSPKMSLVRFLGNHDTNRLATELGGDVEREKMAAALLASLPGPIMIYYGDEIGMPGRKGGPPYWDDYRRAPMDWYASGKGKGQTTWFSPPNTPNRPNDGISVEEEENNPDSLLSFYRRALHLRHALPPLEQGDFRWLSVQGEKADEVVAFERRFRTAKVLVLGNLGKRNVTFAIKAPTDTTWEDLFSKKEFSPNPDGNLHLTLPPATLLWLTPKP